MLIKWGPFIISFNCRGHSKYVLFMGAFHKFFFFGYYKVVRYSGEKLVRIRSINSLGGSHKWGTKGFLGAIHNFYGGFHKLGLITEGPFIL